MASYFDENVYGLVSLLLLSMFGFGMPVYFLWDPDAFTQDYFIYSMNYYSVLWALFVVLAYIVACRMVWRSKLLRDEMRSVWFFIISFFTMSVSVTAYASVYYSAQAIAGEVMDAKSAMYFSIVTLTNLGAADMVPQVEYRLLVASEALLGYVLLGGYVGFLAGLLARGRRKRKRG